MRGRSGCDDIEIVIVDDGSVKDDTAEKADRWEQLHPGIIKAVHQENGGHGQAVNTGLANASGLYFKVVDSDDWLDRRATGGRHGIRAQPSRAQRPNPI